MPKPIFIACILWVVSSQFSAAQPLDSTGIGRAHPLTRQFIYVPSILIMSGIGTNANAEEGFKKEIAEERNEYLSKFSTHVDNYLQFSPIAIAYGLDAMGYRSETDIWNRTVILLKGELLMTGAVFGLKKITHQLRPDHSAYNSFPSGHTAQAFAAATFLSQEYKRRFKWIPYVSYGIASSVGLLRMANNKHYISDVLVGAGMGILSMKAAYLTHRYKWSRTRPITPVF